MNRYDLLKDKYKTIASMVDFKKQAINKITSIYKWEGIGDYIPEDQTGQWLEYKLLKYGCVALGYIDGQLTFCAGSPAGEPDKRFGLPTKFIYYTNGGITGEWIINEDCVVFRSNPGLYPDIFTVEKYAGMLAETDASINAMLVYSRDIPIPLALTDADRKEIESAIDDIRKNKMKVVKSFNLEEIRTLDITKPEMIQYMSNYSLLHDELMKRLYLEFGIAIENKDKKAQLTTKELDAYSQLAGAAFYSRFDCRQKSADRANKLFNIHIEVKPFEYFDDLSNGRNEDFAEDTAEAEEGGEPNEMEDNIEE